MTAAPVPYLPAIVLSCFLLAACSSEAEPPPTLHGALAQNQSNLSDAQHAAVNNAARQMAEDSAAPVHGLRSRTKPGKPGTHVCGYVTTPTNASTPIYVELRQAEGAVTAERGQIGATPANLAKVRFMCRHHGNW